MAFENVIKTIKTKAWCVVIVSVLVIVMETTALNGPNVCMVKQKYNVTKRVKYRAPMWVRTYEWCFSMPPRCSKWNTEMKDLTRLETEERTAEVAVCCPGYKIKEVSCVPICPNGKTGPGCSEDCPDNKWGPNCINDCQRCKNGFCSPVTGECECLDGWQGESCDTSMPPTTSSSLEELLTTLTTKLETTVPYASPKVTSPSTTVTILTTSTTTPTTKITTRAETTPNIAVTTPFTVLNTPRTTLRSFSLPVLPTSAYVPTTKSTYKHLPTVMNKKSEESTTISSTYNPKTTEKYVNTTVVSIKDVVHPTAEQAKERVVSQTEVFEVFKVTEPPIWNKTIDLVERHQKPFDVFTISTPEPTEESTKKETTVKIIPTTTKFKPKEIWIKPTQKGESPITEVKIKPTHENPRPKNANKELTPIVTTPKTIIVSIIPTSVSYTTFKKIALTLPYLSSKSTSKEQGTTKSLAFTTPATSPNTIRKDLNLTTAPMLNIVPSTLTPKVSSTKLTSVTKTLEVTKPVPHRTNSMIDINMNTSTLTTLSTTVRDILTNTTTNLMKTAISTTERFKKEFANSNGRVTSVFNTTNTSKSAIKEIAKANINKITTEKPSDDEEFHILTEPEHITAVMGEKATERTSVDLISVISIAGGLMMAVITVAVIIVMIERCKKPRYEDVRKVNDIRMQVMIDNNDAPPPYVRSIFHTPLPEPPGSEKCHYQPISTLDRNLKQFMRPVVVQTISPIMLENFRGILECHYDHLPRRSHDCGAIQICSSTTPSMIDNNELHQIRASVTECAIEALKCEAKLDIIDNTTSEPLYAEIPYWRPPSEHAVEIINTNGEAVTEL